MSKVGTVKAMDERNSVFLYVAQAGDFITGNLKQYAGETPLTDQTFQRWSENFWIEHVSQENWSSAAALSHLLFSAYVLEFCGV